VYEFQSVLCVWTGCIISLAGVFSSHAIISLW